MLGTYDFCGYYEWTFAWLERAGGEETVRDYWLQAISLGSQIHARELIIPHGIEGMKKYWGHTLQEESPDLGFSMVCTPDLMRIDMQECPSKGFLLRNGLEQYRDYCDHCIGWIGPVMKDAGFVIDHEHNHRGQCWWEIRKADDTTPHSAPGELYVKDARLIAEWQGATVDHYERATAPRDKALQATQTP